MSNPSSSQLADANCRVAGVPENDDDWEGLAAAVYRAVLQMLPASAMSWFGSLRDRSLAIATEVNIFFCSDMTSLRCILILLEAFAIALPGLYHTNAAQAHRSLH